ncbi:MAG: VOC family protein [Gemmatimonadaceae bacterium]
MAIDTMPDGFPTIPILATAEADELYVFLKHVFEATLLDRHDAPGGVPEYMTIRIGDSVLSVMRPIEGQPTRSAFYVYVRDVEGVHRRAIEAGARSIQEPARAVHGDLMATVIDAFGNQWTMASRLENISAEELRRRIADRDQT